MSVEYIRHELLRHESIRESTFEKWQNNKVNPRKLVSAGFYYDSNNDQVICFSCGIYFAG